MIFWVFGPFHHHHRLIKILWNVQSPTWSFIVTLSVVDLIWTLFCLLLLLIIIFFFFPFCYVMSLELIDTFDWWSVRSCVWIPTCLACPAWGLMFLIAFCDKKSWWALLLLAMNWFLLIISRTLHDTNRISECFSIKKKKKTRKLYFHISWVQTVHTICVYIYSK